MFTRVETTSVCHNQISIAQCVCVCTHGERDTEKNQMRKTSRLFDFCAAAVFELVHVIFDFECFDPY